MIVVSQTATTTMPKLKVQLRLLLSDEIALGPGKAELLEAIAEQGSISAAGLSMDMSYRRAWQLVSAMNRCFKQSLVATAKGGAQGGGAQLTPFGVEVLQRYRAMQQAATLAAEKHFKDLQPMLRARPKA